ncbi:hypothetical protein [Gordonia soli]|uniref:hypothetical protein n=1 Tax=Gordonia soli TaxID=320799 RepID=UPI0003459A14|nr:hypothetical protein [Gordonia soli]
MSEPIGVTCGEPSAFVLAMLQCNAPRTDLRVTLRAAAHSRSVITTHPPHTPHDMGCARTPKIASA